MCDGATSNSAGAMAPMIGAQSLADQTTLDIAQRSPPEKVSPYLNEISKLMEQYAYLNDLKSKRAEMELAPDVARTRIALDKTMAGDFEAAQRGELSPAVQKALLKTGLEKVGQTGARIGEGSRGGATVETLYGRGANEYVNNVKAMTASWLGANPKPQVTLDPGSAAELEIGRRTGNIDTENRFRQQLLQLTMQANANRQNFGNSLAQGAVAESMANASSKNQSGMSMLGTGAGLLAAGGTAAAIAL